VRLDTEALDSVWGGTVRAYELDLKTHACRFEIEVVDGSVSSTYRLDISGISTFHIAYGTAEPWDYIEFTSIRAERTRQDEAEVWRLAIELWNADLDILCERWTVRAA